MESREGKYYTRLNSMFWTQWGIKFLKSGCIYKIDLLDPIPQISKPRVKIRFKIHKTKPTQNRCSGSNGVVCLPFDTQNNKCGLNSTMSPF